MNKVKTRNYLLGAGQDYALTVLTGLVAEVDALLGYVNSLYRLNKGSSAPSGAQAGDVYVNDSGASPVLKIVTAGGEEQLGATGNFDIPGGGTAGAGVDLDAAFSGYTRGVKLQRNDTDPTTKLKVAATADSPATVCLPNGDMLQNTATVTVDFSGAADGEYQVYAEHVGGTATTFIIGRALASDSLSAGTQLKIGEATVATADSPATKDFRYIASREDTPEMGRIPRGITHLARMAQLAAEIAEHASTFTAIEMDTAVIDLDQAYDSYLKTFICPRAGLWRLGASVRGKLSGTVSWSRVDARLTLGTPGSATELARGRGSRSDVTSGSDTTHTETLTKIPPVIVALAFGDRINLEVNTQNSGTRTLDVYETGWTNQDTAFTAEYLGPAS